MRRAPRRAPSVSEVSASGPHGAAECSRGWSKSYERNPWNTPLAPFIPCFALFLLLAPLLSLPSCDKPPAPAPTTLTIAAAASVKPALDDIAGVFHTQHPDIAVVIISGASGHFFEQLQNKAPFDLFYSADTAYPHRLAEAGLALPGSERTYATGRLDLWINMDKVPDPRRLDAPAFLLSPSIRKIAIANPDVAPYGAAAVAALKSLSLYDQLKDKLVFGENVEQAAQLAQSGAADAAFLPSSISMSQALKDSGLYWGVPANLYPPVRHSMVIVPWTSHPEAAHAFDAFVAGPIGRAGLISHGLEPPPE
jgi:molybdate transport system substrate-binding protein